MHHKALLLHGIQRVVPIVLALLLTAGLIGRNDILVYSALLLSFGFLLFVVIVRRRMEASSHTDPENSRLREEAVRLQAGIGQPIDEARAEELLQQAYDRGDKLAGMYLYRIRGIRPGGAFARETMDTWANCSLALWKARNSSPEAKYLYCLTVTMEVHKPQYRRQIEKLLPESCNAGYLPALNLAGSYEERGVLGPVNSELAMPWYERTAAQGSTYGISGMGRILSDPQYSGYDIDRAISLLEEAAANGESFALLRLGEIFEEGSGVEAAPARARAYYARAAALNQHEAMLKLAEMLMEGRGGSVDKTEAGRLLETALQMPWDQDRAQTLLDRLEQR